MTPEQAQQMVFARWQSLEMLTRRRFPNSDALAEEALTYVLNQLADKDWQRARAWDSQRRFLPFLLTLASHLLTDFKRHKFGYIRKPGWLQSKEDPLWERAYQLLMVEKYSRREAVEILHTAEPFRERWFLEEVTATVQAKCHQHPSTVEPHVSIEDYHVSAEEPLPEDVLLSEEEGAVLEALRRYLEGTRDMEDVPPQVRAFLKRLDSVIELSEEDQLLLRLRYIKGINVDTIAALLGLQGDVYKRLNKILRHLRAAYRQAGLLDKQA